MSKHLLLEGPSGVGKTTLMLNRLGDLQQKAAGFVTQRMVDEMGKTCGFCLTPAKMADTSIIPYQKDNPNIFIDFGTNMYSGRIFSDIGIQLLEKNEDCTFILIDEIGGVELMEPAFLNLVTELFSKQTPCIGVLKSLQNCECLMPHLDSKLFCQKYTDFRIILESNSNVEIIQMVKQGDPAIALRIDEFIAQNEVK